MENLKTLMLFRCTEKQYAEAFCNTGNMKFSTPSYWIQLEKEEGKGRGDLEEGLYATCNMLDVNSILYCRRLRQDSISETIKGITCFRSEKILNVPCFCLFGLNNNAFSEAYLDEDGIKHYTSSVVKKYFNDFCDNTTKESIKQLPEYKKPALIMISNPHEFFERVRKYFVGIGVEENDILISPVEYIDKKLSFYSNKDFPHELFLKDKTFKYQSEIRIIINTKDATILKRLNENNNIINIGSLQDITHIENFYYDDMPLDIHNNTLLYKLSEPYYESLDSMSKEALITILYQITNEDKWTENEESRQKNIQYINKLLREKYDLNIVSMRKVKC